MGCEGFLEKTPEEVSAMIDLMEGRGCNCIDLYTPNPEMRTSLGRALRGRRGRFVFQAHLCTIWKDGQYKRTREIGEVKAGFEDLLTRMELSSVEIGMIHYVDSMADWEEVCRGPVMRYAQQLKADGVIGHIGLSSHNPAVAHKAVESGLIEVLSSPIIEACPFAHKEAAMSLLHSFYCWGSVGVILLSTLFFAAFGVGSWKVLACLWALIPLCNIYNFAVCPIEPLTDEGGGMGTVGLLKLPLFWIAVVLMVCAGASELSMAQWASAYAESALGLSKAAGDLAGPCMFAVMMGVSRVIYGKYGDRLELKKFMLGSGVLCLACYLTASLSGAPVLGLIGCMVCGFSVGIMWPGTISICSGRIPAGGTAMFALLAMAGDLGGAFGPGLVGSITQRTGDDLRRGMLAGCVFPLVLIAALLMMKKTARNDKKSFAK